MSSFRHLSVIGPYYEVYAETVAGSCDDPNEELRELDLWEKGARPFLDQFNEVFIRFLSDERETMGLMGKVMEYDPEVKDVWEEKKDKYGLERYRKTGGPCRYRMRFYQLNMPDWDRPSIFFMDSLDILISFKDLPDDKFLQAMKDRIQSFLMEGMQEAFDNISSAEPIYCLICGENSFTKESCKCHQEH